MRCRSTHSTISAYPSTPQSRIPIHIRQHTTSVVQGVFQHSLACATEARSRETAEWISEHERAERRYRSPSGRGLRRSQLRRLRKMLAGRYCQLLASHAATGFYPLRADKKDGHERVLGVRQWRAPVAAQPLYTVSGVGPARQEDVEGDRKGVRVKAPTRSLGEASVGRAGYGGAVRFFAHDEGPVHWSGESALGGGGGRTVRERREGRAHPRLHPCSFVFPSLLSFGAKIFRVRFPLSFSLFFPSGGWGSLL